MPRLLNYESIFGLDTIIKHKIYIGWDSREDIAYQVCEHSILRRTNNTNSISVSPLKLSKLRESGHYWRGVDELGSTQFTISRFLVPFLNQYKGWAVFCDCDMVWLVDPSELFNLAQSKYAVMVVKHNYEPDQKEKMDNQLQIPYPRKNWSSLVLWNCGHPKNRVLDLDTVNTQTPMFLHRFQWLEDDEIGELTCDWNWLVGWYKEPDHGSPKILHFTLGGPWFTNTRNCEYSSVWKRELIDLYKC